MSRYRVSRRFWTPDLIIAAFHAWQDEHGRAPGQLDWIRATPDYPAAQTVRDVFGSFTAGRKAAGLTYVRKNETAWDREAIKLAIYRWSFLHGAPPVASEWHIAPVGWPSSWKVRSVFGSWNAALIAAGYEPRRTKRTKRSYRAEMAHVTKSRAKAAA